MNSVSSATAPGVATRYAEQIRELLALHIDLRRSQSAAKRAQTPVAQLSAQRGASIGTNLDLRV